MSTRCKHGDIAIITREVPGCESNVGRLVLVRGPDEINKRGQLTWLITPVDQETPWLVGDGKGGTYTMEVGDLNIEHPDDWMTPTVKSAGSDGAPFEEPEKPVKSVRIVRRKQAA